MMTKSKRISLNPARASAVGSSGSKVTIMVKSFILVDGVLIFLPSSSSLGIMMRSQISESAVVRKGFFS